MSLLIQLPIETEEQLRKEAALHNSSAEVFAAKLLTDQLRFPLGAEFDITDDEAEFFVDAVHRTRDQKLK